MPTYQVTVTYGDGEDRERLLERPRIDRRSAATAAEQYVEDNFGNLDYPKEENVLVRDCTTGEISAWRVTVESEPVFTASPAQAEDGK